jgi:hypothetical protein
MKYLLALVAALAMENPPVLAEPSEDFSLTRTADSQNRQSECHNKDNQDKVRIHLCYTARDPAPLDPDGKPIDDIKIDRAALEKFERIFDGQD